jgi:hypothetical protein
MPTIRVGRDRNSIVLTPRRINSAHGWRTERNRMPVTSATGARFYIDAANDMRACASGNEAANEMPISGRLGDRTRSFYCAA